jgi:C-terminal processing protease CtpA/Prc
LREEKSNSYWNLTLLRVRKNQRDRKDISLCFSLCLCILDADIVKCSLGENIYSWLKVTSFEPENQTDFLTVLGNWIDDYINNGYNKVIIDVSKNGGGIICLALLLQSVLIPQWVTGQIVGNTSQQVWTPYDLRQSNITDELVAIGYFPLGNFRQFVCFFISCNREI